MRPLTSYGWRKGKRSLLRVSRKPASVGEVSPDYAVRGPRDLVCQWIGCGLPGVADDGELSFRPQLRSVVEIV